MHKEGDAVTRPVADPLTRSLPRAEFNQRGAMPSAEELAAQQNVMRFRRELLGGATEAPQAMLLKLLVQEEHRRRARRVEATAKDPAGSRSRSQPFKTI